MDLHPIVTVVIPAYNYAGVVERAIKSVMAQTVNNLECFVVDDGSTDNSEEVVRQVIEHDKRFTYIKQSNAGVANARNKGVSSGTGKYICCLDADDQIKPEFLEACITYLEEHPEIGIAYTGLWLVTENGKDGLSEWPGEFNYDKQLEGYNQIPTCNVARREVWDRLGGQRQRYAPEGAGEEDAELWLRAGAYGFRAKKVTDAGLFLYSWRTGRVSGNREHRMTDYLAWHPWTRDGEHPFASVATPEKSSHAVRQYDNPLVSVIIPVGPGHEQIVITALDSLDAQSYRKWECIIAWDSDADYSHIQTVYPHAKIIKTGKKGAGAARNAGVKAANAPLVLFLDADDWILPDCLKSMMYVFARNPAIIYTDYIGKATIDAKLANDYKNSQRLLEYDEKTGFASILGRAKDYDCEMAQRQPDQNLYIWNLVTSLVPKAWHNEIGGFDESMKSWEDWDYYIRLAKAGKCFYRVEEPMVVYRYYSGTRRETGLQSHQDLLQYMLDKYRKVKIVACNCGKKNSVVYGPDAGIKQPNMINDQKVDQMSDSNYVLAKYNHLNVGGHRVIGPSSRIDYGYRSGGDEFLVHKMDVESDPQLFTPVRDQQPEVAQAVESIVSTQEPTPAPKPLKKAELRDFVTDAIARELEKRGYKTVGDVAKASMGDLQKTPGLTVHKARKLRQDARARVGI